MKGAPPLVDFLLNLCPLCVIAMPIITIFIMIKLMKKPNPSPSQILNLDDDLLEEKADTE
jgi:hypothetical protein